MGVVEEVEVKDPVRAHRAEEFRAVDQDRPVGGQVAVDVLEGLRASRDETVGLAGGGEVSGSFVESAATRQQAGQAEMRLGQPRPPQ